MALLRGITWDHKRGYAPLVATTAEYKKINPEFDIVWDIRSLKDFGDYPIDLLADKYDLLMIDHPFIGSGVKKNILVPLDDWIPVAFLQKQEKNSVGPSYKSYTWEGKQYALAVDAAAQVAACRKDLMEQLDLEVPKSWNEVFELTKHLPKGKYVGMPLVPTDCICSFMSICANMAGNQFLHTTEGLDLEIGEEALNWLSKMVSCFHPESLGMNPIQMLNKLSSDDEIVYVPLTFGYSNYSREGFANHLVHFTNIPSSHSNPTGSIVGGVGISISNVSKYKQEAAHYLMYVASEEIQKGLYFESGGQPGHRKAWTDDQVNNQSNGFFMNTLDTLDNGYLRPRFPNYNIFQEKAGVIIHNFLKDGGNAAKEYVKILDQLFKTYRNIDD